MSNRVSEISTGGGGGSGTVTSISGSKSVKLTPNPLTTSGVVELQGDSTNPGNLKFYGTDNSGVRGWLSQSSIAGAAAGSTGDIQINNGGIFDVGSIQYNFSTHRLGLQVAFASTEATLHVDAIFGDTIAPPASLSASLVLDAAVDSPGSASATQVNGPDQPVAGGLTFTYIDQVRDTGFSATQNTGESGYLAANQNITYVIYAYRLLGGVYIVNPNSFNPPVFTDSLGDGTPFGVDLMGWGTDNASQDGFILVATSDQVGSPYAVDIGNVTSYSDLGVAQGTFGNQDFETSVYASSGASWADIYYSFKNIGGSPYNSDGMVDGNNDSNISGAFLIIIGNYSIPNDGVQIQTNVGNYFTSTTGILYDWGGTDAYDGSGIESDTVTFPPFSSIAFPYFNTTIAGATGTTPDAINYGAGSFFAADGSTWDIEVWEYRLHPLTGVKYYVSSPDTGTYGADDNSGDDMTFTGNFTVGDGDGAVVKLLRNGTVVAAADEAGGTSWNFSTGNVDIDTSLALSSYTGLNWAWQAYGQVVSPAVKYSSTHKDYSASDNNPTQGFVWQHSFATFGNAVNLKVLENDWRGPGSWVNTAVTSVLIQDYQTLGNAVVTPSTVGFVASGQTLSYTAFSTEVINGTTIYSATGASVSQVFPNDGLSYVVNLTIASVAGATYKIHKIGVGYEPSSSTSFQDNTTIPWNGSSTLTPTQATYAAAIFQKNMLSVSDNAALIIRNTGNNVFNTGFKFTYNNGGTGDTTTGQIYIRASGHMGFISNTSQIFVFGGNTAGSEGIILSVESGTNTIFNNLQAAGVGFLVKTPGNTTTFFIDPGSDTAYFGSTTSYDPIAAASFKSKSGGTDAAAVFWSLGLTGGANGHYSWQVRDNTNNALISFMSDNGWLSLGDSALRSAILTLGTSDTNKSQIFWNGASSAPTSAANGDMWFLSPNLQMRIAGTTISFLKSLPTGNQGKYWYDDGSGFPVQSANITTTFSGSTPNLTVFQTVDVEFKVNITLDNSKTFSFGAGLVINTGSGTTFAGNNSFSTIFMTTTLQKMGFWGAAGVSQPANTVALDTLFVNVGFRASGGVANFATTIKPRTGGTAAGSEPIQMTSAALLTTATVGTIEFLTDSFYATITTGAARKEITLNDSALTSGKIPVATTNGRLMDSTISSLISAGVVAIATTVSLTNQGADIGSTNFTNAGTAGLYRVSYTLEDTTTDVTAGAVTLTIAYTDGAGSATLASTAVPLTGVGIVRTQGVIFIQLASGSISYSTSHTGIFGSAKYALYMTVERLL